MVSAMVTGQSALPATNKPPANSLNPIAQENLSMSESNRQAQPSKSGLPANVMKQTSKTSAELGRPEAPSVGHESAGVGRVQPDVPARSHTAETHWSQSSAGALQEPAPKQQTERDESASSQAAASASMDAVGEIAFQDATGGVDTDRGPLLDAVYNESVIEGHRVSDDEAVHGERDRAKSTSSHRP